MKARLGLALVAALLLAGCAVPGSATRLEGAVYAHQIPIYPSAQYDGTMGGTTSGSVGGPAISKSQSWFFKTDDSIEEVTAWYEEKLPGADKEPNEDGVTFTLVPDGADDGEKVSVWIHPGSFSISESVKPETKQDDDEL
jgi:hypothetical protein